MRPNLMAVEKHCIQNLAIYINPVCCNAAILQNLLRTLNMFPSRVFIYKCKGTNPPNSGI